MTHAMFSARPARHHPAPHSPAARRRAEEAFLDRHDGWGASALERPFVPAPRGAGDGR